jgi:hypothetical protein
VTGGSCRSNDTLGRRGVTSLMDGSACWHWKDRPNSGGGAVPWQLLALHQIGHFWALHLTVWAAVPSNGLRPCYQEKSLIRPVGGVGQRPIRPENNSWAARPIGARKTPCGPHKKKAEHARFSHWLNDHQGLWKFYS